MINEPVTPLCTVELILHTLVLMDADGNVLATHDVSQRRGGRRSAKRLINVWARTWAFDVANAMSLI